MSMKALAQPFLNLPVFQGLNPLQITETARRAERIVYKAGDTIILEDDDADAAILIVSGEAVRTSGPDIQGAAIPIPQGSLLAEMAMLVDTTHSSTVVARTPVRALRITRSDLHEQMEADPAVAEHFLHKIVGNLHRLGAELHAIDRGFTSDGPQLALHA